MIGASPFTSGWVANVLTSLQAALGDAYALDREVARGGMAIVFLAQDGTLPRPVAIKMLQTDPRMAGIYRRIGFPETT